MESLRMCCVCREMKPKAELLRVVKAKGGSPVVDLTFKADGRGAYVCKNGDCIAQAKKRRVFERAFKGIVDAKIYEELENLMPERA